MSARSTLSARRAADRRERDALREWGRGIVAAVLGAAPGTCATSDVAARNDAERARLERELAERMARGER